MIFSLLIKILSSCSPAKIEQPDSEEPNLGKKLPGTSARFAPRGQGVVWGQSGVGPHAKNEAHYIPSIEPYYRSLNELAKLWR
jgi:hypothetical protein